MGTRTASPSFRDLVDDLRADGWTVNDLAEEACVSTTQIYQFLAGRVPNPRPLTVRALADAMDLDFDVVRRALEKSRQQAERRRGNP